MIELCDATTFRLFKPCSYMHVCLDEWPCSIANYQHVIPMCMPDLLPVTRKSLQNEVQHPMGRARLVTPAIYAKLRQLAGDLSTVQFYSLKQNL